MVDRKVAIAVPYCPEKGKYLSVKRSKEKEVNPDVWEFPSGQIEQDEEPRQAALRELEEETALDGEIENVGETHVKAIAGNTVKFYTFLVKVPDEEPELSWEHSEFRWVTEKKSRELETQENYYRVLESVK